MIQQINLHERMGPDRDRTRDPSVPQWLSGISRNDWRSPINSFPAADRLSDESFERIMFWGRNYRCANPVLEKSIA